MNNHTRLEIDSPLERYSAGAAIGCTIFGLLLTFDGVYLFGLPLLAAALFSALLHKFTDCAYFIDGQNETIYYSRKVFSQETREELCSFKDVVNSRSVELIDGKDSKHGEVHLKIKSRPIGQEWVAVLHCDNVGIANGKGAKLAKRLGVAFQKGLSGENVEISLSDDGELVSAFVPSTGAAPIDLAGSFRLSSFSGFASYLALAAFIEMLLCFFVMISLGIAGHIGAALLMLALFMFACRLHNAAVHFQYDDNKELFSRVDNYGFFTKSTDIGSASEISAVAVESNYVTPKHQQAYFVYEPVLIFKGGDKFPLSESPFRQLSKANKIAQAMANRHKTKFVAGQKGKSLSVKLDPDSGKIETKQVEFDRGSYWQEFALLMFVTVTAVSVPFFIILALGLSLPF